LAYAFYQKFTKLKILKYVKCLFEEKMSYALLLCRTKTRLSGVQYFWNTGVKQKKCFSV